MEKKIREEGRYKNAMNKIGKEGKEKDGSRI